MNVVGETYLGTGIGSIQSLMFNYRILRNQYVSLTNYSATQTIQVTF